MTLSSSDPYTMEMRLCDDDGMVSHEAVIEPGRVSPSPDESYLARLNRLRNMSRTAHGDKPEFIEESFTCTGNAHLAAQHIRCTSPAHQTVPELSVSIVFGHHSTAVHQWHCPLCNYTVSQSKPFTLEECPSCQDGKPKSWSHTATATTRTYG